MALDLHLQFLIVAHVGEGALIRTFGVDFEAVVFLGSVGESALATREFHAGEAEVFEESREFEVFHG